VLGRAFGAEKCSRPARCRIIRRATKHPRRSRGREPNPPRSGGREQL